MLFEYLKRGLVAGLVAGLAFGVFMAAVGNPFVTYVDELAHGDHAAETGGGDHHEEAEAAAADGGHGGPVVSMTVTKLVSIVSSAFWGLLFGAVVFGIAFYFLEPAIPGSGATKSYLLAGAGFVTVSGAPWLALPPVAPGMEQALATQTRLVVYAAMMVAGAVASLVAGSVYRRLRAEFTRPLALLGAAVPLAALLVAVPLAPANPTTGDVPATLATAFRGFVVVSQLGLWFVLASTHAWLQRRSDDDTSAVEVGDHEPESVAA